MPHSGAWDSAGVQEKNEEWNEPLVCRVSGEASAKESSFLDMEGTGYSVSAFYRTDDGYVLRLFNADGDETAKSVRLGFPVKDIVETDLLGNETAKPSVTERNGGIDSFTVCAPRYSVRTYLLKTE